MGFWCWQMGLRCLVEAHGESTARMFLCKLTQSSRGNDLDTECLQRDMLAVVAQIIFYPAIIRPLCIGIQPRTQLIDNWYWEYPSQNVGALLQVIACSSYILPKVRSTLDLTNTKTKQKQTIAKCKVRSLPGYPWPPVNWKFWSYSSPVSNMILDLV